METPLRNNLCSTPKQVCIPETPFLKKLGYGTGVGVYHLDRTKLLGKSPKSPWALKKVLRTHQQGSYNDRLLFEANILKTLNHPNIIGYRGFTTTEDGRKTLAMEECSQSLGDMVENKFCENSKAVFSSWEIVKVCVCVASALDYLHNEIKLIHGDLKSYNILINGNFKEVKLCDFGVSLKVNENGEALDNYVGTSCWSAPEALLNEKVTTKVDIFSLGMVIYEMIALKPPHLEDEDELFDDELNDTFESDFSESEGNYGKRPVLPDIKLGDDYKPVLEMFYSCTEEDPNKRPTARDIVNKLSSLL